MAHYCSDFTITSTYNDHLNSGRPAGIDYATPIGTALKLFEGGYVRKSIDSHGGIYITVDIDERKWLYVHLRDLASIKTGTLTSGEFFGYAGNTGWTTGPHTHVELRIGGKTVDPQPYINELLNNNTMTDAQLKQITDGIHTINLNLDENEDQLKWLNKENNKTTQTYLPQIIKLLEGQSTCADKLEKISEIAKEKGYTDILDIINK